MERSGPSIQRSDAAPASSGIGDRVEISDHARLLERLSQVPAIRAERVEALKAEIAAGVYETPERIAGAVEKLLAELEGRDVF